ncbi:MAG: hypothetical protein ACOX1P_06505 [Thermoguttaceae bacterium]|jgi:hypothetical protein
MTAATLRFWLAAGCCLLLCSCGQKGPPRDATFPVTGEVHVDGSPADKLTVTCHSADAAGQAYPIASSALTDAQGKFSLATYESGDGLREGEYVLAFAWRDFNVMSNNYTGPDKLNGRYTNPENSSTRFTVAKAKPVDLGRIELTGK